MIVSLAVMSAGSISLADRHDINGFKKRMSGLRGHMTSIPSHNLREDVKRTIG